MQGQSSDKSDRNDQTFGHLIILLIFLSNKKQVCNRKIMTKQAGDTPKVKLTKKEAMKKAAGSSRKISDWIKPKKDQETELELMDWSDDADITGGDTVMNIEKNGILIFL